MIDKVLAEKDMVMLNLICVGIVVVFLLRGIFYYGQSYLVSFIGQKVIIDVREVMFRKFQRMPMAYFDRHQTGEVMSYITNDVAAIQSALVDQLIEMVTEGSILIGSLVMMIVLDWKLSILTLVIIPLVGQAMKIFGRKIKRNGTVIQERMADITSLLQESVSSIRVVKSFVRENYEIKRFCRQNELNFQAAMKNVQLTSLLTPSVEFLAAISVTVIIWFGGYEVVNEQLTAGALVAFLTYAVNLANPVKRLSRVYGNLQRAMAAVDRVFAVIDLKETIADKPDAKELPKVKGHVVFDHVSFEYKKGVPALSDVSLEVKPGQMIAFVGPSGAGKSTIANLIPRFYEVTSAVFPSMASTSATSRSRRCASRSASCRRRRCSSRRRCARTSATAASTRRTRKSSRRPRPPMPTASSVSCRTATTRRSVSAASTSRAASASAWPLRAPSSRTRRS